MGEGGALGAQSTDSVETGGALAISANFELVRRARVGKIAERRASSAVEPSTSLTLNAPIFNQVVAREAATRCAVPFGPGSAQLRHRNALLVEGTHHIPLLACFLVAALVPVPEGSGGTGATLTRSDLVEPAFADARNPVKLAVGWTGRHRSLDRHAPAVLHEVAGLADTTGSVEERVEGTGRYNFAFAHQILAPLDADTFVVGIAVHLISSANGDGPDHAHSLTVLFGAASTDAFYSVVDLVAAAHHALVVDHKIPVFADAQSVVIVGICPAVEIDAFSFYKSVAWVAQTAVTLHMEVTIFRAVESIVANVVPHNLVRIVALTLTSRVVLTFGTGRNAKIVLPVHVVAGLTDASSREFVVGGIGWTIYLAYLSAAVVAGTYRTGTTHPLNPVVSRSALTQPTERIDLRARSTIHTVPISQSKTLNAYTFALQHRVSHPVGTGRNAGLSDHLVDLARRTDTATAGDVVVALRAFAASSERVEVLPVGTVIETFALAAGENIVKLVLPAHLALAVDPHVIVLAYASIVRGIVNLVWHQTGQNAFPKNAVVIPAERTNSANSINDVETSFAHTALLRGAVLLILAAVRNAYTLDHIVVGI